MLIAGVEYASWKEATKVLVSLGAEYGARRGVYAIAADCNDNTKSNRLYCIGGPNYTILMKYF